MGDRHPSIVASCDGFSNWNSTVNRNYSIVTTPFGQDTFGLAHAAFSARGIRVGAYVCPSFWNNDNYFWPSAATALGTCCQPTYDPSEQPAAWAAFVAYLHEQVGSMCGPNRDISGAEPPAPCRSLRSQNATRLSSGSSTLAPTHRLSIRTSKRSSPPCAQRTPTSSYRCVSLCPSR